MIHRVHEPPARATLRRFVVGSIAVALLVGAMTTGCDSGARRPRAASSSRGSRESSERRVRIATQPAEASRRSTETGESQVTRLSPGTARESAVAVPRHATEEALSLGAPSVGRRKVPADETLSVLERYLKQTRPSREGAAPSRIQPSRRVVPRAESVDRTSVADETSGFVDWQPIFRGIDRVRVHASRPRLMEGQALRIDTQAKGIRFFTTPKSEQGGDTLGLRTSTFLQKYGCQVAVNAAFFSPMQGREGRPVNVLGVQISNGEVVSNDRRHQPSLLITRDNQVKIATPPFDLDGVYNAVTGDELVLEDGRVVGSNYDQHPRVCAGVSRDKRYVYLLTVDGRQGGWSYGATKRDLGNWLKRLGAWDGLNLDGGGTAVMVVEERGRPRIITRPIHNNISGNERVSGSHLGVMAEPLPE